MPLDRNHFRRSRDAPTVWNGYLQTSSRGREVNPATSLDAGEYRQASSLPFELRDDRRDVVMLFLRTESLYLIDNGRQQSLARQLPMLQ